MKKLLSLFLTLISLSAFSQTGSISHSGIKLRVNDTTAYQSAVATAHAQGYADIYYNNQATTKHFDIWNGSSYDHVFDFGGGSGTGVTDGDKGDITVGSSGTTYTIDNLAVTNAKINDVAVGKITGLGTGVGTALSVNVGSAGAPVLFATAVVNTFTADHVLALTDVSGGTTGMFGQVRMNLTGTANNVTVPLNATVAFQIGTEITILQQGTGITTVVATGGVTITSSSGSLVSKGQNQPMVLKKTGTNTWDLYNGNAGAALTKTDDTNVTLTLGGSASSSLLAASSLTLGWTGTLSAARGGTGASNATQTYTPTLTNSANVAASTAQVCQYYRNNNVVTVSGQLSIDPTTTATLTTLGISVPIASNFTTAFQAGGTAAATNVTDGAAGIISDATNDRVTLQYMCIDVTNHVMAFSFTYQILP